MASLALAGLLGQVVGAQRTHQRPMACAHGTAAEEALLAARARFERLPPGGGRDPEGRALLLQAAAACPSDARVQDEVGEGLRLLQEPLAALALFARAARRGLWHHPLQRVLEDFQPKLRSARLLGPIAMEELPELREMLDAVNGNWATFRAEFLQARQRPESGFVQLQQCPIGERCWQRSPPRWRAGSWSHYYVAPTEPVSAYGEWFWDGDSRKCNWAGYPKLCALLMQLRRGGFEVTQVAITQVQGPRTHIPAHRSQQWRLRLVCPLVVPRNSTSLLRFPGFGVQPFRAGQCWWFDESYEHELIYQGPSFRAALILDLRHPGLDGRASRGLWADTWWNRSASAARERIPGG